VVRDITKRNWIEAERQEAAAHRVGTWRDGPGGRRPAGRAGGNRTDLAAQRLSNARGQHQRQSSFLVSSRDIRLVIIDAGMPGSARLAQTLETKPGIRVLRVSSGPAWRDEPGSVTSADTPHIRRPVTALELREKLRVLLQPAQRR